MKRISIFGQILKKGPKTKLLAFFQQLTWGADGFGKKGVDNV